MTGGDLQELQEQLQQTTTTNWTSNGNATSTAVDGSDTSNNQHGSIIPSTQHVQQQQFMQHLINDTAHQQQPHQHQQQSQQQHHDDALESGLFDTILAADEQQTLQQQQQSMHANNNNSNKRSYAQFLNLDPMNPTTATATAATTPAPSALPQAQQDHQTPAAPCGNNNNIANNQASVSRFPSLPLNSQHYHQNNNPNTLIHHNHHHHHSQQQQTQVQNQAQHQQQQPQANSLQTIHPPQPSIQPVQQQQPNSVHQQQPIQPPPPQTQDQIYHASHGHYSANGTANASAFTIINTDFISDARRKMNLLISSQSRAEEELKNAQHALELCKQRVDAAARNLNMTNSAIIKGTEDLTDALLQEPTHWNAMYRKLVEFKETHGHVDVKRNPIKADKESNPDAVKLGAWVGRVRLEARRPKGHPDHIEPYKVIALDRLGFDWDPRENYWQKKFEELKEFIQTHPESKMPTRKTALGVWCDGQVLEYNKFLAGVKPCYITQQRINQLNSIGFIWNRMGNAWAQSFQTLKQYRKANGHCHVPVNHVDKTLFRWIAKQRKKYRNYKEGKKPSLSDEQVKLLEEIDFFESSELRIAKYNAQKEREKKLSLLRQRQHQNEKGKNGGKRGRPVSKSLIPQEAQEMMASRGVSTVYPSTFLPMPMNVNYAIPIPPSVAGTATAQGDLGGSGLTNSGGFDNAAQQTESTTMNGGGLGASTAGVGGSENESTGISIHDTGGAVQTGLKEGDTVDEDDVEGVQFSQI